MRFGINTWLFISPFQAKDIRLFPQFRAWGFDSVELPIEDTEAFDTEAIKQGLQDSGMVCGSVSGAFGPERDLRGTKTQQENTRQYVVKSLEKTAELGCHTFIGPLYSATGRASYTPPDEYQRQWEIVVQHLGFLADEAGKLDITICLEPLNRFETDFINTTDQALKMIRKVNHPNLQLMLDTFHMNIEEKYPAEAIRKAGPHLKHLHACGSDRGTPGNDHTDWQSIKQALQDINYQGDIVIESFTPEVKIIAKAASIWRQIEPVNENIAKDGVTFLKDLFST